MRVLIFGDSITQGYWDTEGGWVDRLRKYYDELQVTDLDGRDEPTIFNLGISADNSANVVARIESEIRSRTRHNNPPIIIVQIGINDSSKDSLSKEETVSLPIHEYEQNLRAIINTVKVMGSKLIFVGLSACDESKTRPVSWGDFHYTNSAIKTYEDTMKNVAAEYGIAFISVFNSFAAELKRDRMLLSDGLHPNNEGHEAMFDIIGPKLFDLLVK